MLGKKNIIYSTFQVGLVDSSNPNKMPILVKHFFKDPIHQIDFGPLKGYEKRGLYIVSEGRLGIYDLQNLNNGKYNKVIFV